MMTTMTQKKCEKDGSTRTMPADIAREMAKPRITESVRKAAVVALGPKLQETHRIGRKVIRGDVTKSAKQPSEWRFDKEASSRMRDEGGQGDSNLESDMNVGDF
jgi:hypothetical protein